MTAKAIILGATAALGTVADSAIDANTHIPLGGALAVGVTVVGIAIWLGREFQKIKDRDEQVRDQLAAKDKLDQNWHKAVMARFDGLPCEGTARKSVDCPKGMGS